MLSFSVRNIRLLFAMLAALQGVLALQKRDTEVVLPLYEPSPQVRATSESLSICMPYQLQSFPTVYVLFVLPP